MKTRIIFIFGLILISRSAWAVPIVDMKSAYEERLEAKAMRLLQQHLADNEFLIYIAINFDDDAIDQRLNEADDVEVEAVSDRVRLPLLPFEVDRADIRSIFKKERQPRSVNDFDISRYIASMTVNLTVDEGVDQEKMARLREALASVLRINKGRGDRFNVEASRLIALNEKQLQDQEFKQKQLALITSQINETNARTADRQEKKDSLAGTIEGLETPLAAFLVAIGLAGLGGLLFLAFGMSSGRVVGAIASLGSAYLEGKDREAEHGGAGIAAPLSSNDGASGAIGTQGAMPFNDADYRERDRIIGYIRDTADKQPYIIVKHLKDQLVTTPGVLRAAAVLEVLGSERYVATMEYFSKQDIGKISGVLNRSDAMASVEGIRDQACKDIYGRLVADEMLVPDFLGKINTGFMSEYTDEELAQALQPRSTDEIIEVFATLTPRRAARVYQFIDGDKSELGSRLGNIGKINKTRLRDMLVYLKRMKTKKSDNLGFEPASYLSSMMHEMREDESASLMNALQSRPELASAIKENFIVFSDISRLSRDVVRMLVAPLPVKQAAVVLASATSDIVQRFKEVMPAKSFMMVEDEMNVINSDPMKKRRNEIDARRLRDSIAKQIAGLVDQGMIDLSEITIHVDMAAPTTDLEENTGVA